MRAAEDGARNGYPAREQCRQRGSRSDDGAVSSLLGKRPEDWDRYFRTNLQGVMNCCHIALPGMIKRGSGRIVTIVSDAGRVGEAGLVAYSAAKAGAAGFVRAIAKEVGRYGITSNAISLSTLEPALDGCRRRRSFSPSEHAKARSVALCDPALRQARRCRVHGALPVLECGILDHRTNLSRQRRILIRPINRRLMFWCMAGDTAAGAIKPSPASCARTARRCMRPP